MRYRLDGGEWRKHTIHFKTHKVVLEGAEEVDIDWIRATRERVYGEEMPLKIPIVNGTGLLGGCDEFDSLERNA